MISWHQIIFLLTLPSHSIFPTNPLIPALSNPAHCLKAVQEMRDREQSLHREKKNIRVQMKSENVERVLRQGEYKKSLTLKKIETCDR